MTVQRLTAAYRSRPRPSSTPGAKASTVNSYYLDGERLTHSKVCESMLNYPQSPRRVSSEILALCSFQGPPRRTSGYPEVVSQN